MCWPGPSTSQTDRGTQVPGGAVRDRQAVRLLRGLHSHRQDGCCPRGCSGGGSLPQRAPLRRAPPELAPFRGLPPVKAQPEEEELTDLCTSVEIRRQEALPLRGLAETGWPWAGPRAADVDVALSHTRLQRAEPTALRQASNWLFWLIPKLCGFVPVPIPQIQSFSF